MSYDLPGTRSVKGKDGSYTTICERCGSEAYGPAACGCTEKQREQYASDQLEKQLKLSRQLRELERKASRCSGGRVTFDNL